MENYTKRREAWITAGIDAGIYIGTQRMAYLMALALNDPEVMGKGVLGADRIKKVYTKIQELQHDLSKAWLKCDELKKKVARLERKIERMKEEQESNAAWEKDFRCGQVQGMW